VARFLTALLIAATFAGGRALREGAREPSEAVHLELVPQQIDSWEGADVDVRPEVMQLLNPDGFLLRVYRREGELPMQVYVDYHRVQRLGSTIHSPRICYPGAGWQTVGAEVGTIAVAGEARPGCWLRLQSGQREMQVLYWYESRWGRSARETDLKKSIVRSALTRRPADAALLRFATPLVDGDEAGARERILGFVNAAEPSLRRELPFARPLPDDGLESD
jgi:EpsI family protein